MTNYKLTIAYDGANFHGFQSQPKLRTVQGVLEKALTKMSKGQSIDVIGSGRTDAGVHALGQVVSFEFPNQLPADSMLKAVNSLMPLDVIVKKSEIVDADFHARFGVKKKTYQYRVDCGHYTDPFKRFYTGHYPYPFDVDKIKTALKDLEGEHDFTSFAASGGVIENKVRTIYRATVDYFPAENELVFEFTGNGFLYNMVRILVATLLEIGNGRRAEHDFLRLFEIKDRQEARGTAPASGLYLKEVFYD
ncbi:tRNA pseudouridine(38-40) synthase TruA [Companilactobacillus sp.]|jgi:tRNA pseudouridine38-40 synthase|uniref:tRNA pseudouridine(38-40) synthase TruA n=1 Tax=Companilactobacillus sp. TaxID=2767905 RepID=UPI0025C245F5|nr:tRNA pseudouridine(38-40) synthase TruA [Companilactobacillus sp.]MCH4010202.1 tRNA pseudouridine(38-40) synthase TruA [Companilactobacillus sp.]MCH4052122.1 tRNA pseudouridine(38-40) synthase TruA [Companilactobacillus sp.]MCH4078144.1 tRNA pseudouridine(38-40) synthase TruA [Companilactobacillus sp.]MCH4126720.1 tRNA pseudouridine(38-40) synthase TruA [Companilactobacillus sp.]MCH4132305.1 tRNA pseudouridine(38-40) synthase TruA [Companilactobacillus sp.]